MEREANSEYCSLPFLAFHGNASSVLQHDLPDTGEPDPVAADSSNILPTLEAFKDAFQILRRNPYTFVLDPHDGPLRVIFHRACFEREVNLATSRAELDRVLQQIAEHAINSWAIPHAD